MLVEIERPRTTDVRPISKTVSCDSSDQFTIKKLFSKAGQVSTPGRAQLKPEKVDQLVFLAKNL